MTTAENTSDLSDDPFDVWFAPTIDHSVLRGFMRRTNRHALLFLGVWIVLCAATGYVVVLSRGTWWVVPAMVVYGSVLCFAYAVSHECAHGTAFRTRWLNEAVFSITSLIFIEEPLYRRYAHAEHHTHTWFNSLDPQKPYGNPLTLMRYLSNTLGLTFYVDAARQLMRHGAGRFTKTEREYIPPAEIRKASFNSRVMAACYLALLVCGIALQSPWPFLLYFIPRFLGGCVVTLYVNTQHMCMAEDIYDHRLTTRSIDCSLPERLLYWNMNYHIEHHLYPAVPFHALPALNRRIKDQLPPPLSSVVAANVDILRAVSRQRKEPQFNLSRAD